MNSISMFLIRRKADGMFYSSRSDGRNGGWVKQINKARPFKNTSGAKTSQGWYGSWKTVSTADICEECKNSDRRNYNHTYTERYRRARYRGQTSLSKAEHLQQWITRNGRKPCWVTLKAAEKDAPLEVVKVTMTMEEHQ